MRRRAQAAPLRRLVRHRAPGPRDARYGWHDHRRRDRHADPLPARVRRRPRDARRRRPSATQAVDGVSYLVFVAPALLATATITVASEEFTYPVMLGFKWNRRSSGMNASPLRPRRSSTASSSRSRSAHARERSSLLLRVHAACSARSRRRSAWLMILVAACSAGLAFGAPLHGLHVDPRGGHGPVRARAALHLPADDPVLRHVLPARRRCRSGCSGSAGSRRSGTHRARARVHLRATTSRSGSRSSTSAYLVALVVVGWVWARRIAARRLDK